MGIHTDYKVLFESCPGLYLILLPDFTIIAASDAYLTATLTKRENIVGKNIFQIFPLNPADMGNNAVASTTISLQSVLNNKTAHTMAVQRHDVRKPDGTFEIKYWSPVNKPLLNEDNEVVYIFHSVEDVTDFMRLKNETEAKDRATDVFKRKYLEMNEEIDRTKFSFQELKASEESYKDMYNSSLVGLYTTERGDDITKGKVISVNDIGVRLFGYNSRQEFIEQFDSKNHYVNFQRREETWENLEEKGELGNWVQEMKKRDGTTFWVNMYVKLSADGTTAQSTLIDITQQVLLQEALESKVKERTLELNKALTREQELNEMKSRFVSMASHEFRTPLSAILSSVFLIRKYPNTEDQPKREKHIRRVESSVSILTDLLNDLLSVGRIEEGKIQIHAMQFEINEFTDSMIADLQHILKAGQKIRYAHSGSNQVFLDPVLLKGIMINLISNAIKFSPEDSIIKIATNNTDEYLKLTVTDMGMGISKEDQEHLFERFFRGSNAGAIQGTGLGLHISGKYTELMNGRIVFQSELGYGTRFVVTFAKKAADKTIFLK